MKLVVTDTNVFIDMMDVGALVALFGLGLEVHTTAFVVDELASDQQTQLLPYISTGRLKVAHFDPAEIAVVEALQTTVTIGFTDRSVVHLATRLRAMVLSGDGKLWKVCKSRRLEVHGSLWVVEQAWVHGLVPPMSCIARLEQLERLNSRLPKDMIAALIERIRKSA